MDKLIFTKEMVKDVFEILPNMVFINRNGRLIYVNEKCVETMGYSKDEFYDENFDFMTLIDPKDINLVQRNVHLHLKGNEVEPFEYQIITKSRKKLNVIITTKIIDFENGKVLLGIITDITERVKKRKLEQKITRIDEHRIPFTNKEKLGFYGIVKYPNLNDNQIARKINMSRPTLTSIKNRLKGENFYKVLNIPRFDILSGNILSIIYFKIENFNFNQKHFDIFKKYPEIIYKLISNNQVVFTIVTSDLGVFKKIQSGILGDFEKLNIKIIDSNLSHYPFNMSEFKSLLDYSPLLNKIFELNFFENSKELMKPSKKRLSNKEKLVFLSLVEFPYMNFSDLSKKINVARVTISQMKNKFVNDGLLVPINMPLFSKLNLELIVLCNLKFNKMAHDYNFDFFNHNQTFSILNKHEASFFNVFNNYTELSKVKNRMKIYFKNLNVLEDEPKHYIFPLKEIKLLEFSVAPLLKKLFKV